MRVTLTDGYLNNFQLEEGTVATTYEPYQYNKSSILLPCQLEKVGDVRDRLFRREDGIWCIEKNIGEVVLNGNENWVLQQATQTNCSTFYSNISLKANHLVICNRFAVGGSYIEDTEGVKSSGSVSSLFINILKLKLSTQDVQGFKTWLSQNPTLVKYQLTTPQIIELQLDTQIQLNSYLGTTNVFTEDTAISPTIKATVPKSLGASINSLVNKTDNLSQRVENVEKLKEGSELEVTTESGYVVCENTTNGQIEGLKVEGKTLVNLFKKLKAEVKPSKKYYFDYNGTEAIWVYPYNSTQVIGSEFAVKPKEIFVTPSDCFYIDFNIESGLLLEGDHTQNPPSYFDGLKSVGDGTDKIEVLSLRDCNTPTILEVGTLDSSNGSVPIQNNATDRSRTKFLECHGNKSLEWYIDSSFIGRNHFYDVNKKWIGTTNDLKTFTTPSSCRYLRTVFMKKTSEMPFIPKIGTQNKKQILFKNKEGNYEKPIIRSTGTVSDTIEKHSDGKYYFHKRCGEVVLNGSENWNLSVTNNNTCMFTMVNLKNMKSESTFICDKFIKSSGDVERMNITSSIWINILKTKLVTQDLAGFKTWLQSNNVTVVYQLATEEVYEVVNLDLDSYEGETSVIFDGGVISPKISFKIASHIGNTITVLKDRINYLEGKVINMFKAVLAGDVQSLAYELYPDDFKHEEDIENNIVSNEIELL